VLPSDSRNVRPDRRARRRTNLAAPERLESRELMASNPLGFSVPDLTITGSAGTQAAWGGTLGVTATVINQGSSTITNPIAQAPGDLSTADAPASTVAVVITPRPSMAHAVTIGTFQAPPIIQNSLEQIQEAFTLPARPKGFAASGGRIYVHLIVNSTSGVLESNRGNNISQPIPVQIAGQARPDLVVTGLDIPSTLQPGDTISPTITITNNGTAPSGPVEVALVASTERNFNVGSSIVALYEITGSIPPASAVAPGGVLAAFSATSNPITNSLTFTGPLVTLPVSPAKYYLGVVIDPYGKLTQLRSRSSKLSQIRVVKLTPGLPPAGVVSTPNTNLFPIPASGVFIGINPTATTTSSGTGTTTSSTIF
jgi:hypothetical protein